MDFANSQMHFNGVDSTLVESAGTSRRKFVRTAAAVLVTGTVGGRTAIPQSFPRPVIKAVALDAFAIFDPSPVFRQLEVMFPGRGAVISDEWRTRQFEYTWLRNSLRAYTDFWHVTQDALNYATKKNGVPLKHDDRARLMAAYMELKPWPDVIVALQSLQERGLRLALLSNMTTEMMRGCVKVSGLQAIFEYRLSTDQVKAFKPDPAAYRMGLDAFRLKREQVAFVAFGGWDAAGAKHFGYPTYWVNRSGLPAEELGVSADASHSDLSALPSFIDSF
jgi:2-haloacid dehalogenase